MEASTLELPSWPPLTSAKFGKAKAVKPAEASTEGLLDR